MLTGYLESYDILETRLFFNNFGGVAGLQQVTSEQRLQRSINIFIHIHILNRHVIALLQMDDHRASCRVGILASTTTHVHSVHKVSIVHKLKVVVVVSMGDKSRAEYVHSGHWRCERS